MFIKLTAIANFQQTLNSSKRPFEHEKDGEWFSSAAIVIRAC